MRESDEGRLEELIDLGAVPFTVGLADHPHNPAPLPDCLTFRLGLDLETGLIRQCSHSVVSKHLSAAYEAGSLLGTAMDDTPMGRIYAGDFLDFLQSVTRLAGKSILEIGAGRGYLLSLLRGQGAEVLGIEPGRANAPFWSKHGVPVVNAFFPTLSVAGKFDLIVGFALLEHIEALNRFLTDVRNQLLPQGLAVFAVPDCRSYIADGDPGMLLHEHWNYFTGLTLATTLTHAGFKIISQRVAGYGGVLYVAATPDSDPAPVASEAADVAAARKFGAKCIRLRRYVANRISALAASGRTLGVYVPGRILLWATPGSKMRFFDDDPELHGRYYPPFGAPIENRDQLRAQSVDELWIMSRSFGARIANELSKDSAIAQTRIVLIDELLENAARHD